MQRVTLFEEYLMDDSEVVWDEEAPCGENTKLGEAGMELPLPPSFDHVVLVEDAEERQSDINMHEGLMKQPAEGRDNQMQCKHANFWPANFAMHGGVLEQLA